MSGSGKPLTSQAQGGGFEAIIPGTSQAVSINSASIQSAAFGDKTSVVRMFATQDCLLAFGANPTVSQATGYFLPGGIIDFVGVNALWKVAVIQSSAVGVLYLTEGA